MWRVRSKERKCLVPVGSILSEEMESIRAVVMWKRRISQAAQNSSYTEGCDKPIACGSPANPDRKVTF